MLQSEYLLKYPHILNCCLFNTWCPYVICGKTFLPHIARNILCGKIVCHWTHSRIVPSTEFNIQYTYLGGHVCMSGHLRNQSLVPAREDKTNVYDGTVCGENKVNTNFTLFYMWHICLCMCVYAWKRERERQTETDEDRETERQTDRENIFLDLKRKE